MGSAATKAASENAGTRRFEKSWGGSDGGAQPCPSRCNVLLGLSENFRIPRSESLYRQHMENY